MPVFPFERQEDGNKVSDKKPKKGGMNIVRQILERERKKKNYK